MYVNVVKALLSFNDGSYLYVYLGKYPDPADNLLVCSEIIGLPEGTPADKPSMGQSLNKIKNVGTLTDILIPMSRISAVKLMEEVGAGTQLKKDMEELWK